MIDILSNQAEIIASLQQEAISLRQRNPPASASDLIRQINDASVPLRGLNDYQAIAQIRLERDEAIGHLCKLIDLLLGTNTIATMAYTQDQIDAAYGKAKIVLEFFNSHSQELADLQAKLEAALADDTTDKSMIVDLQGQLASAQANLDKFVSEFTDQPAPPPPPPAPVPPVPAPDSGTPPQMVG